MLTRVPKVTATAVPKYLLIADGPKKKYEFSLHQSKILVIEAQMAANLQPFAIEPLINEPSSITLKSPSKKCL